MSTQVTIQNARIIDNFYLWEAYQGINNSRVYSDFRISDNYWLYLVILAAATSGNMHFKGLIDCSGNPNYPAATIGDVYEVSVKGKIGGVAGIPVEPGDLIIANATNAGGTQGAVGTSWDITQFGLQQIFEISGSDLSFAVLNDLNQTVGNDWNLSVINDIAATVGNNMSLGVVGNFTGTVGGNYAMTVTGTWAVSGTNFSVAASGTVTINDGTQAVGYVFTCVNISGEGAWAPISSMAWLLDGNTVGAEKWIGTVDNFDLPIRVNSVEVARFKPASFILNLPNNTDGFIFEKAAVVTTSLLHNAGNTDVFAMLDTGVTKVQLCATAAFDNYINNNGSFGINTASPDSTKRLTINAGIAGAYDGWISFKDGATLYSRYELSASINSLNAAAGTVGIALGTNSNKTLLFIDNFVNVNNIGIDTLVPTARLHLPAGTVTAKTAPLKFTAGTLMGAVEIGAMEFVDDGTTGHLYITVNIATVATRVQIV